MSVKVKILIGTLLTIIVLMGGVIYFLATDIPATAVFIEADATPAEDVSQDPSPSLAPATAALPSPSEPVTPEPMVSANEQMPEDTAAPKPTTKSASTPKPTTKPTTKPTVKPTTKPTATLKPTPTVTSTPAPTYNPPATPRVSPTPQPSNGDGGDTPYPTDPYSLPHL